MGPRNLLILFFSTVAVSLVILIIFFSLFFKNVDLNFNTRLPESAPDIGRQYANNSPGMNPESKADGLMRSTVNVPPEMREPEPAAASPKKKTDEDVADSDLPPVSDDIMLENEHPAPIQPERSTLPEATEVAPVDRTSRTDRMTAPPPRNPRPTRRQEETPAPVATPVQPPAAAPVQEAEPSGPPVPGQ